jgi:glycosyltransferase involved in cell wall biosynthesis
MQPWVMKQHRLKKLLGWFFYQETDLKNAQALITTAEIEAEQMRLLGYEGPIRVVPNGVDEPSGHSKKVTDPAAKKIALFLARIHPKKGLGDLIEAWTALKPTDWILYGLRKLAGCRKESGRRLWQSLNLHTQREPYVHEEGTPCRAFRKPRICANPHPRGPGARLQEHGPRAVSVPG